MASFETIVRPVVFPNIRPQAPRVLPPEDDPEQGLCVIKGNPAKSFDLAYNFSFSASSSSSTETERLVDVARVYQKDSGGTVNRNNFVDIEVASKIKKRGYNGDDWSPDKEPGATTKAKRQTRWPEYYKKVGETTNVEVKEKDQTRKNPDD